MAVQKIVIRNEEEAWAAFQQAIEDKLPSGAQIDFEGWPVLHIRLQGELFHSTITTEVMGGFIDLERQLRRAYALMMYGSSGDRLKERDKQALRVVVKVGEGSSEFWARVDRAIQHLADMVKGMDSKDRAKTILGIALVIGGVVAWKGWLENQAQALALDAQQFTSAQETQRMQLMAEVFKENTQLRIIQREADEHYNTRLRSFREADGVVIDDVELDKEQIHKLSRTPRDTSVDIRIESDFLIDRVGTREPRGFTLTIREVQPPYREFSALAASDRLTMAQFDVLKDAAFAKQPITLRINARDLRGDVVGAEVWGVGSMASR